MSPCRPQRSSVTFHHDQKNGVSFAFNDLSVDPPPVLGPGPLEGGAGVADGLKGVVADPIAEVRRKGPLGLGPGLLKGFGGLLGKPLVGLAHGSGPGPGLCGRGGAYGAGVEKLPRAAAAAVVYVAAYASAFSILPKLGCH